MGMRSNASVTNSNAAAAMAPALTELVSQQAKLSSPATGASPRPGYLTISNNGQLVCLSPPLDTNKETSNTELPQQTLSNGPANGPSVDTSMEQQPIDDCSTSNCLSNEQPTNVECTTSGGVSEVEEHTDNIQSQTNCGGTQSNSQEIMGLQKDFLKDNAEMEQMLGELSSTSDIDLMQVFKSFVSAPTSDNLCDLAGGLSLFNDMNMDMNMGLEEVSTPVKEPDTQEIRNEISKRQSQMTRKLDFLIRRLRKLQALSMGHHINEEINGLFEYTQSMLKRKERESKSISTMTPLTHLQSEKSKQTVACSMKTLLKRLEFVSTSQQSSLKEKTARVGPSTDAANLSLKSIPKPQFASCVPSFDSECNNQLEHTAGLLQAEMHYVAKAIDSDATASSSGGESADEMVTYNNPAQQSLPIGKRAAWRWNRDRAGIASRWSWLLAQISDLEYRIHQHSDLHNQIKRKKGAVILEDVPPAYEDSQTEPPPQQSLNGYRGILPGNSKPLDIESPNGASDTDMTYGSSRTRGFQRSGFRKRKLLQTTNLHTISKKAARQSTVKCGCQWPLHPCALCTGRQDPTAPRDLPDMIPMPDRVAVLDFGFHPVISFPEDVPQSVHIEATLRSADFQHKAVRSTSKSAIKSIMALQKTADRDEHRTKKPYDLAQKKYKYQKKYNLLASKLKKKSKKIKMNRRLSSVLGKDYKSLTAPSTPLSDGVQPDSDFGPNGILRSRNASPTQGSSHKTREHYSDRKNRNSYDIDNIVIHSVAASTRVEPLPYKEIPTPKWRVCDDDTPEIKTDETNPVEENEEEEEEDISSDGMIARHERAFLDERKKFSTFLKFPWSTRSRANRRIDSQMDSSGANTPDPTSPAPETPAGVGDHESVPSPAPPSTPLTSQEDSTTDCPLASGQPSNGNIIDPNTLKPERRRTLSSKKSVEDQSHRSNSPEPREVIQPFEPLEFPLTEASYEEMLQKMPSNHQTDQQTVVGADSIAAHETTSQATYKRIVDDLRGDYTFKMSYLSGPTSIGSDEETESVESGMIDEDPNDPEWFQPPTRF
ncbi:hypothetical protein HA402_015098 [Bradysia odoriphaga]|nr:hypothetical protein HA402_015098 [Bradysia odoriphaga]